MRKNKVLLLVSSLCALLFLLAAAVEENVFKDWRRLQRSATSAAEGFDVHLRQVVVPALAVTDRCVSCHVGMAPGEPSSPANPMLRAHADVVHDPGNFGCTVCHGGQGRATEKDAAHGSVPHWPEPMIPTRYADAGCGSCHTHLAVPDLEELRAGLAQFERHDCLACHRLDGRGGTLRPLGAGGMEGPDLSRIGGHGYAEDWYARHLERSRTEADGPWRASFGAIDEPDLASLRVLLDSRVGAPRLVEAKSLVHSLGCRGCHKVGGVGGDDGPSLDLVGQKDPGRIDFSRVPGEKGLASFFREHFRSPASVVPGSQMPVLGLTEDEIDLLTHYMFSLRRSVFPEAFWPKDRVSVERFGAREFATDGATLYGSFCAACHGRSGEGMRYPGMAAFPAILNPDFLAVASDEFLIATITHGRPGRRMPAWGEKEGGLRPAEIRSVAAYLRQRGNVVVEEDPARERRWIHGETTAGGEIFGRVCAACHGKTGEGGEGPALKNRVLLGSSTDTYLRETIRRGRRGTTMEGFGRPSSVRPALSGEEIDAVVSFLRSWEEKP